MDFPLSEIRLMVVHRFANSYTSVSRGSSKFYNSKAVTEVTGTGVMIKALPVVFLSFFLSLFESDHKDP